MDDLSLTIRGARIALDKRAAADVQFTIVKDNTSEALASALFEGKRAASDGELGVGLVFDGIQTAGITTAVDRQIAVVVDHRRAGVARRGGHAFEGQRAVILNGVIALAADDGAVFHSCYRAGCDGQRRLARAGIRQRLAAEVEGDALVDSHVLGGVRQQRHSFTRARRINRRLQRRVLHPVDLGGVPAVRCCRHCQSSEEHEESQKNSQKFFLHFKFLLLIRFFLGLRYM